MDVRMPMKEFPVRLDGRDHARYHIMTSEEALGFGLQAGPRAERELAQQLPIKAGVESETLGDGEHDLSMRDGKTDLFGHVDGRQQTAFLVAGGAGGALFARIGNEHLVLAVGTADAGEALVQITALEKGRHGALDDRPPEAVLGLKTFVVESLEGLKMLVHQAPQMRGEWIAGAV
jgi:hypothetical protein